MGREGMGELPSTPADWGQGRQIALGSFSSSRSSCQGGHSSQEPVALVTEALLAGRGKGLKPAKASALQGQGQEGA